MRKGGGGVPYGGEEKLNRSQKKKGDASKKKNSPWWEHLSLSHVCKGEGKFKPTSLRSAHGKGNQNRKG